MGRGHALQPEQMLSHDGGGRDGSPISGAYLSRVEGCEG